MLNVQITISGDKKITEKLKKMGASFDDWSETLHSVGDYLMDVYSRQAFDTEGGILGIRWQNLSPIYELWKAKHYPGRGILERTGALKKGFTMNVQPKRLELQNLVKYAYYHQKGKGVPQRQIIGVDSSIKTKIIDYFKIGIHNKLVEALK